MFFSSHSQLYNLHPLLTLEKKYKSSHSVVHDIRWKQDRFKRPGIQKRKRSQKRPHYQRNSQGSVWEWDKMQVSWVQCSDSIGAEIGFWRIRAFGAEEEIRRQQKRAKDCQERRFRVQLPVDLIWLDLIYDDANGVLNKIGCYMSVI